MAKYEKTVYENFDTVLNKIKSGIMNGSISATLEDSSDMVSGDARCSIRVFERYSAFGQNRVSMNVTLFQNGNEPVRVCAITSGGSQAMFFKINTLGEDMFLEKLKEII